MYFGIPILITGVICLVERFIAIYSIKRKYELILTFTKYIFNVLTLEAVACITIGILLIVISIVNRVNNTKNHIE